MPVSDFGPESVNSLLSSGFEEDGTLLSACVDDNSVGGSCGHGKVGSSPFGTDFRFCAEAEIA